MKKITTYQLALVALMAALTCVLGPISITVPVSPVPIALANFIILLSVSVLGWKLGTISCALYILLGLCGLPVFAGYTAGAAKLFGPTGGYIIGYIFMALIAGLITEKFKGNRAIHFFGMVAGTIVLYIFGTAWLAFQAGMGFYAALLAGVIPFILGDLVKIIIVMLIGPAVKKPLDKALAGIQQ